MILLRNVHNNIPHDVYASSPWCTLEPCTGYMLPCHWNVHNSNFHYGYAFLSWYSPTPYTDCMLHNCWNAHNNTFRCVCVFYSWCSLTPYIDCKLFSHSSIRNNKLHYDCAFLFFYISSRYTGYMSRRNPNARCNSYCRGDVLLWHYSLHYDKAHMLAACCCDAPLLHVREQMLLLDPKGRSWQLQKQGSCF